MAYRIDDDENRIQDLTDKIDQLEVQTFSPEVVARNESTRNTGVQTGDGAATNPYPEWYPVRDFGTLGNLTLVILLNRTDSQIAKMTLNGDVDFAFEVPPPLNKGMWFILDVTIDAVGGHTIYLPGNVIPASTTIDNAANARTVLRISTTDGGATYFAENLSTGGGLLDPVILNENNFGQVGLLTLQVDWSIANFHRMVLGGDISLVMINLPKVGKWQQVTIEFTQDPVGGHIVTFLNTFFNGIVPVVNTSADSVSTVRFYAYNTGTEVILSFNTISNFEDGVSDPVFMVAKLDADQLNVSNGNTVDFDDVTEGSGLVLSNGIVSGFVPGHIYECISSLGISETGQRLSYQFFENTAVPQLIGTRGIGIAIDTATGQSNQSVAHTIFKPSESTDTLIVQVVEVSVAASVDILEGSSALQPQSTLKIVDITGFAGGGGTTVLFPKILINDVVTVSGVTGTIDIDFALAQHWVLELVGNVTLTFINAPVSNDTSEQIILEYIQDIIGGHVVTYVDVIAPIDPPVVTTAGSREVITGFSRRTNGGTILFNLYLVGN